MGRNGARSILDSSRDGVVLFGGVQYGGAPESSRLMNDLWRLRGLHPGDSPRWSRLDVAGESPSPRWIFGITYDAAHDRAIIYGGALGFTSPCANDTWILDHASGIGATPAWKRVKIDGPMPPPLRRTGPQEETVLRTQWVPR